MKTPPEETKAETLRHQAQAEEQKRLQQNIEKTVKAANDIFPNETWVDAIEIKLDHIKLPDGKGNLPGPDAIVNGSLFEFKTVTGKSKRVGRDLRTQGYKAKTSISVLRTRNIQRLVY